MESTTLKKVKKNGEAVKCGNVMDRQSSWEQESGNDVISFTFTAPMTRSRPFENTSDVFSGGSQSKRTMVSSDCTRFSKFSFPGHSLKGGDALSTLLEQKLKELARTVEMSQQNSGTVFMSSSSTTVEENQNNDAMEIDYQVEGEETSMNESTTFQAQKLLDCRLPSPVSVLEHSSFVNSYNSSENADSSSTRGSKQCSSLQVQQVLDTTHSSKTLLPIERDIELLDSASSNCALNMAKRREITLTSTHSFKKPRKWEFEYVNKILCNIETTFNDYAIGRAHNMISPHLFYQLESWNGNLNQRRLMFDCVSECLELRFRHYICGGFKLWDKGLSVIRRKDRLAEELYKEISSLSSMGDYKVDELVDKDMSSQHGKWLDFETEVFELGVQIESRILNMLIDEVVADILVL